MKWLLLTVYYITEIIRKCSICDGGKICLCVGQLQLEAYIGSNKVHVLQECSGHIFFFGPTKVRALLLIIADFSILWWECFLTWQTSVSSVAVNHITMHCKMEHWGQQSPDITLSQVRNSCDGSALSGHTYTMIMQMLITCNVWLFRVPCSFSFLLV